MGHEAHDVLTQIGGVQFGQPDTAEEAYQIALEELKPGQQLVRVAWDIFIELLIDYEDLDKAFGQGISMLKPGRIAHRFGDGDIQRAEDLLQEVAISAWRSFPRFRPLKPYSWEGWLAMIVERKLNNELKKIYRTLDLLVSLDDIRIWDDQYIYNQYQRRREDEWPIREVCERWINRADSDVQAAYAAQLLAMWQGQSGWVAPTGTRMMNMVGASSQSVVYKLWKQFIAEVTCEQELTAKNLQTESGRR